MDRGDGGGGGVKELEMDGWRRVGGRGQRRERCRSTASKRRSRGRWRGGEAQIQMGKYFGKQPPDWPATETANNDPSSPARKQS